MYLICTDKMYTPTILVCESYMLNRSESCEPRCVNETACCLIEQGSQCFEYNGETPIEICEPGNIIKSN